jgi:hypothetical protein
MKRYVRAVLGGFLAILAAFGWTVAISFFAALKYGNIIAGVRIGLALWILLFLTSPQDSIFLFVSLIERRFQTEALPTIRQRLR